MMTNNDDDDPVYETKTDLFITVVTRKQLNYNRQSRHVWLRKCQNKTYLVPKNAERKCHGKTDLVPKNAVRKCHGKTDLVPKIAGRKCHGKTDLVPANAERKCHGKTDLVPKIADTVVTPESAGSVRALRP